MKNNYMGDFISKIVEKIKNFLNKIFSNKTVMLNEGQDKVVNKNIENNISMKKTNVVEEIKRDNKKKQTVQEIIDMTEKSPSLLKNLSYDQLDVIDNYYKEENAKLKDEIQIINKKIAIVKTRIAESDKLIDKYNLNAG